MSGIVLSKEDRAKLLRPSRKNGLYTRAEVEALCSTIDALESAIRNAPLSRYER